MTGFSTSSVWITVWGVAWAQAANKTLARIMIVNTLPRMSNLPSFSNQDKTDGFLVFKSWSSIES
jgi:hypothetical protein